MALTSSLLFVPVFHYFQVVGELRHFLLYCLCFPNTVGCGNHHLIAFVWRPLSAHVSESSRAQWFLDQALKRAIIKRYFHLESRKSFHLESKKWAQCFCPVQARLEIPNNLIRELLISNYNNFQICKSSWGSP